MAEIIGDKACKNLTIRNNKSNFITINNKNIFKYDDIDNTFQIDEHYLQYAVKKLKQDDNGKFYWENYEDKLLNTNYENRTNDTYFDVPYYLRNDTRK